MNFDTEVPYAPMVAPQALEEIKSAGVVDISEAKKETESAVRKEEQFGRFQEAVRNRADLGEQFKAQKEEEKADLEKTKAETAEKIADLKRRIQEAETEQNEVGLGLIQKQSQREILELGVLSSEVKLETAMKAIDDETKTKGRELQSEYRDAISKIDESHRDELDQISKLLDKYEAEIEAGKVFSQDEVIRAFAAVGKEAELAAAQKVSEGAVVGKSVENERLENVSRAINEGKAAAVAANEMKLNELNAEMIRKRADVTKGVEEEVEGMNERLGVVDEEMGELDERKVEVGLKLDTLRRELSEAEADEKQLGLNIEGFDKLIGDLEISISKDKEMLSRVVDRIASVESRGRGAVANLEQLARAIGNRGDHLRVLTMKAQAGLDVLVTHRMDAEVEIFNSFKAEEEEAYDGKVTELLERMTTNFLVEIGPDGRIVAKKDLNPIKAVREVANAWRSVEKEEEEAERQKVAMIERANEELNEKLAQIDKDAHEGDRAVMETAAEARRNIRQALDTINHLREQAIGIFGQPTLEPVTDPVQLGFVDRALKFVKGLFR